MIYDGYAPLLCLRGYGEKNGRRYKERNMLDIDDLLDEMMQRDKDFGMRLMREDF